jgi:hypothetical protein
MRLGKELLTLIIFFQCCFSCPVFGQTEFSVENKIETRLLSKLHHNYDVRIFNSLYDPYKTLAKCTIFIAASLPDSNLDKPKGFIGIYTKDSIIWQSEPLTKDLTTLGGIVASVDDYIKDGKVEIVISQDELPGGNTSNYLWIFSWDGNQGKLISQRDERGESVLCFIGNYTFIDLDGDGISEIQGEWYTDDNFDKTQMVTYSWNGSSYGHWGKNSKWFTKQNK